MDAWTYETDDAFTVSAAHFPRPQGMMVWMLRSAVQLMMRIVLRTYHRLDVVGRENLPVGRSFIMVCNHSSHLDAVCLLASLPLRRVHDAFPVAAADYFFATRGRSGLSTIAVNALPLDRRHGAGGLDVCRELLTGPANVLIIFPEGTRSCSGELGRFRSGVARLVAGTGTPVVPCHLSGAFEAWPKGRALPRPHRLRLCIGRPRTFADVSSLDREAAAHISSQLRDEVAALGTTGRSFPHAAAPFGRLSDSGSSASISSSE